MAKRKSIRSGPLPGRQIVGVRVAESAFGTVAPSSPRRIVVRPTGTGAPSGLIASGTDAMASVRASCESLGGKQSPWAAAVPAPMSSQASAVTAVRLTGR